MTKEKNFKDSMGKRGRWDLTSESEKTMINEGDAESNIGLYVRVKCPNCGRALPLTIVVYQLPSHKRKIKGWIEGALATQEYKRFLKLETIGKIVFAIGKFYDVHGKWPNEKELRDFVGLTEQTISKYVNNTTLVSSEPQKRGVDGRYEEKTFYLTNEGKTTYSELIYKILGYE